MVRAVLPTGGELLFCNHHAQSTVLVSSSLAAVLHHPGDAG